MIGGSRAVSGAGECFSAVDPLFLRGIPEARVRLRRAGLSAGYGSVTVERLTAALARGASSSRPPINGNGWFTFSIHLRTVCAQVTARSAGSAARREEAAG